MSLYNNLIVSDMANFELRSFDTEFISRTLLSPVDVVWLTKKTA